MIRLIEAVVDEIFVFRMCQIASFFPCGGYIILIKVIFDFKY